VTFEPDEPVRYGQVWKYIVSKNEPIVMVIGTGPGEGYIRTLHLTKGARHAMHIDLEDSGWAALADHKPTHWERLR